MTSSRPCAARSQRSAGTIHVHAAAARNTRSVMGLRHDEGIRYRESGIRAGQGISLREPMELKTAAPSLAFIEAGITTALTFDDVLLVPQHSTILPTQVDAPSWFTRNIRINVPLCIAATDTM